MPDGKLVAPEIIGGFDLPEKFGKAFLFGEDLVYGHIRNIDQRHTSRRRSMSTFTLDVHDHVTGQMKHENASRIQRYIDGIKQENKDA